MGVEEGLDVTREAHLGVDEHHDVVTDPLEVGHDVRREHHAELLLGDGLHEQLEELAARERVQARDRLVEDQQLGALGQAEGERELGPLAARQPPGPLAGVEARAARPSTTPARRPTRG